MHESSQNQPSTPHSSEVAESNEWETVTFPDAVSVEQLSQQLDDLPVQPSLVSGDFYLKVQSQNDELRSQVAELEAALSRSQTALRAEMERWEALALAQSDSSESSESRLEQQNQALSASQDRLGHLFMELESSHRMAQRQQILVETLTEQLQNSHEQIAQLERECAAVQQRASESSQQLAQSEQTAKDLRSRLHRQQRYTLQFKAALEKCLDVPPATAQGFVADFLEEPAEERPIAIAPKVKIPKSQPVQPWGVNVAVETAEPVSPLQTWANAIVDTSVPEQPLVQSVVQVEEEPIEEPVKAESSEEADQNIELNLDEIQPNLNLEEAERQESWAQVMAQVNAIMGESVTIVESPKPLAEESNKAEQSKPPIAPLIAKNKAPKRESLAAIDLPSFPKRSS